jgi:hypothetical protein
MQMFARDLLLAIELSDILHGPSGVSLGESIPERCVGHPGGF